MLKCYLSDLIRGSFQNYQYLAIEKKDKEEFLE